MADLNERERALELDDDDRPDLDAAVRAVLRAIRGLRYGSVEITVHDGEVVQIERKEKVRLRKG